MRSPKCSFALYFKFDQEHRRFFILDFCDVRGNQPTMRPKGQFLKFGLIVTHEAGVHPSNLMNVGDKKWFLFLDSCC